MKKKDWVTKIRYSLSMHITLHLPNNTRALVGTNLFKRTDKLEDGSKDVTYGLELDKETYKKIRKMLEE